LVSLGRKVDGMLATYQVDDASGGGLLGGVLAEVKETLSGLG
jgi:hypothetical protein